VFKLFLISPALIADSSDLGWRVVQEYEANPLADESNDEKKLFKAEARAERKVKAEKSKKTKRTRVVRIQHVISFFNFA
jgi:hypothetical protein